MNNINIHLLTDNVDKHINKENQTEFYFHYQKAILLALMQSGKLTHQQYEECCEKLMR